MMTIHYLNKFNEYHRTDFNGVCPLVITLGNFDGIHIGHIALLKAALEESKRLNAVPTVWTLKYGRGEYKMPYLTDINEKIDFFNEFGIAAVISEDFDTVRGLSPEEFTEDILINKLRCVSAVCGFNFNFGKNGSGNAAVLRDLMFSYGKNCIIVPPVVYDGNIVSSTLLRKLILSGEMETAAVLLGRPFSIKLTVISGNQIGRTIGVPTINQIFPDRHIIPACGVYCTRCAVENGGEGGVYNCVTNVGSRPTVTGGDPHIICETHIIGFDGDLYGREIKVSFYKKLRDEKKFGSVEELKTVINNDIIMAGEYFNNVKIS